MSTLRRLRQQSGLTQEQLAAAASLSQTTISDVERGISSFSRAALGRVAVALAVPLGRPPEAVAGELVLGADAAPLPAPTQESCTEVVEAA